MSEAPGQRGQASHSARQDSAFAKRALFFVLGVTTLFVIFHDERFFLDPESPTWKFFYPVRWKLFLHATGGATALALGALQFSNRLRQRYPAVHRVLGRFYIAGVLVAAPVAIYLAFTHALAIMKVETATQASVWVLTTVLALVAARKRSFEVHRQWMMRSYAITVIFVASRVVLAIPAIAPTTDAGAEHLNWILIICALLVPQLIINWRQFFAKTGS